MIRKTVLRLRNISKCSFAPLKGRTALLLQYFTFARYDRAQPAYTQYEQKCSEFPNTSKNAAGLPAAQL